MQSLTFQVTSKPAPIAPTSAFWDGFTAHSEGVALKDMPTREHANGWWHGHACAADTVAYEDDMMDRAFWSRGQW